MLIEFNVQNFLSFRDTAKLSMVKGGGSELADTNTFVPMESVSTPALLRSTAVYGPNASGKSNFVRALRAMQQSVLGSASAEQRDKPLPVSPFRLDADSRAEPSEFEVLFVSGGVRYQYGFAATTERVIEEWLLAYPKGRPQRLIERRYDADSRTYEWGGMTKLAGAKKTWREATRSNALFLSTAVNLNSRQLAPAYDWFAKALRIAGPGGLPLTHSLSLCEDSEGKRKVLEFLAKADIPIDDVQVGDDRVEERRFAQGALDALQDDWGKKHAQMKRPRMVYELADGAKEYFDWTEESGGTRRLFEFAGPISEALEFGHVVVIDELDSHLHPLLAEYLVQLFHSPEFNTGGAQLLFTTHDASLLNQKLLRRDQVWFCRKDKTRNTRLYPLLDMRPRKGSENLEHGYLSGRYGAVPCVRSVPLVREVSVG